MTSNQSGAYCGAVNRLSAAAAAAGRLPLDGSAATLPSLLALLSTPPTPPPPVPLQVPFPVRSVQCRQQGAPGPVRAVSAAGVPAGCWRDRVPSRQPPVLSQAAPSSFPGSSLSCPRQPPVPSQAVPCPVPSAPNSVPGSP